MHTEKHAGQRRLSIRQVFQSANHRGTNDAFFTMAQSNFGETKSTRVYKKWVLPTSRKPWLRPDLQPHASRPLKLGARVRQLQGTSDPHSPKSASEILDVSTLVHFMHETSLYAHSLGRFTRLWQCCCVLICGLCLCSQLAVSSIKSACNIGARPPTACACLCFQNVWKQIDCRKHYKDFTGIAHSSGISVFPS